jgi:hypothetical protein
MKEKQKGMEYDERMGRRFGVRNFQNTKPTNPETHPMSMLAVKAYDSRYYVREFSVNK